MFPQQAPLHTSCLSGPCLPLIYKCGAGVDVGDENATALMTVIYFHNSLLKSFLLFDSYTW